MQSEVFCQDRLGLFAIRPNLIMLPFTMCAHDRLKSAPLEPTYEKLRVTTRTGALVRLGFPVHDILSGSGFDPFNMDRRESACIADTVMVGFCPAVGAGKGYWADWQNLWNGWFGHPKRVPEA